MIEIKIFRVLNACPTKKIKQFSLYVQSPYFKMTEAARELAGKLIEHVENDQAFDKNEWLEAHRRSESTLRQLCNEIMRHFEQFLSLEGFQNESYIPLEMLIKEVDHLGLLSLLPKAKKTLAKMVEKDTNLQAYDHYQRFRIGQLIADIEKTDETPLYDVYLSDNLSQLDAFYFIEKLRLQNDIAQRKRISKNQFVNHLLPEITEILNEKTLSNILLKAYYTAFLMQTQPENEVHYTGFKKLLNDDWQRLESKTYRDLLSWAMNYCIGRMNVGNDSYSSELFEWYNVAIDRKHILENQFISSIRYKNIITLGLRQKAFEWVENFIESYTRFLEPSIQTNYYTFSSAQLHFYKKDFNAVLTYLRDVQYDDMMMSIRSKAMLLATYYELNEIVPLYALADSYRTYINRRTHKLSEKKREYSLNLIKFVLRLSKISSSNVKAINKLEQELMETKRVYSSAWILEKIKEKKARFEMAA